MMKRSSRCVALLLLRPLLLAFVGSSFHFVVKGLAPPMFDDYEPLEVYRKRLNITFQYTTKYLPPGHCRYLTEAVCQKDDEEHGAYVQFMKQARRQRYSRQQQSHQGDRKLNPSLSLGDQEFKVLVLLVRFTNHIGWDLPTRSYFDTLMNGKQGQGPNRVGSIAYYLHVASLGRYRVVFDVQDWITTDNTEAFYSEGKSGLVGNERLARMIRPVLNKLDADPNFPPWSRYDISGGQPDGPLPHPFPPDKRLDHVLVIHSGYGAELGDKSGCDPPLPNSRNRIWSQGSAAMGQPVWFNQEGYRLHGYSVGSAFGLPRCGGIPSRHAVLTHEYLHGFQLQDLYDLDTESPFYSGGGGAGNFDIMANLGGFGNNLAIMGHMGPYSRYDADWLEYIEITRDGIYAIQPSEISAQVYQIKRGYRNPEEYLLLENRQKMYWDATMPSSGLVVWHIDESKARQNQRSWPGHPGWPQEHYKVRVIQADGKFELEKNINRGNAADFFDTRGMELGPGPDVQPNTDSYYNGPTGVRIKLLTDSKFIMLLYITGVEDATTTGTSPDLSSVSDATTADEKDSSMGAGWVITWILSFVTGMGIVMGLVAMFLV